MSFFITLIYQPFLNILVFFYWMLGKIPGVTPDMGVAVVLLSIVIRIVLLPATLASDRNEAERREIGRRAKEIETKYATDPVRLNQEIKKLFKTNPRVIVAEMIDFGISVLVTVLLIRIFATGIEGADLHLLYPWLPKPEQPFNLIFLGHFDLAKPNFILNVIQSLVILMVEIVAEFSSPFHNILSKEHMNPVQMNAITKVKDSYVVETRNRVRSLQVILPIVSFLIFMFLPAGKKLFIITTLLISMLLMLIKMARRKLNAMFPKPEEPMAVEPAKAADSASPASAPH